MWLKLDQPYKSLAPFPQMDLPNLVVISGENGAGKTHLLQGISERRVDGDWGPDSTGTSVRYITSEQLGSPPELQIGGEPREQLVARFQSTIEGVRNLTSPGYETPQLRSAALQQNFQSMGLSPFKISELEHRVGKPLIDWTHDDCVYNAPNELGVGDLFGVSVGEIFGRYNQLVTANEVERVRADRGDAHGPIRTTVEFRENFGLPPWELLNIALESVGLAYRFEAPEISMLPLAAPPALRHMVTGDAYPVGALSSGEKTLLSVALSIYSAGSRRDYMRLPSIVLLDEPDATLHPSMIRSLLRMLHDQFVGELGIRVIMTTHSPTTVALAPDDSLFVMHKWDNPKLRPAGSKDAALNNLLVGVPTVSVNTDHRRIVVVESPFDERRYTKIVTILGDRIRSERSLVFMAAGSAALPDGSAAVIDLVGRLRSNGNQLIWGLVDRDDRRVEPSPFVVMDSSRYTIENLVLDPVSVGLLLLLENFAPTVQALSGIDYVQFDLEAQGQAVVDYVASVVGANGGDETLVEVQYVNEVSLLIPSFWLNEKGHELAQRIRTAFRLFERYEHDQERMLLQVIDRVWNSRPGLVPMSTLRLLERLLAA